MNEENEMMDDYDTPTQAWRKKALEALIAGDDSPIGDPRLYSIKDEIWDEIRIERESINKQLCKDRLRWRQSCEEDGEELTEADEDWVVRHSLKHEVRWRRRCRNSEIAWFWRDLLKRRPEFADRCPWRFFQNDHIWQSLEDRELLTALKMSPAELFAKFNPGAMSEVDKEEVRRILSR